MNDHLHFVRFDSTPKVITGHSKKCNWGTQNVYIFQYVRQRLVVCGTWQENAQLCDALISVEYTTVINRAK